ncbi:MAG: sulfatase [Planctomycetota bacterium]
MSTLLILLGTAVAAAGLLLDVFGVGERGLGPRQLGLAAAGFAVVLLGLARRPGTDWRAWLRAGGPRWSLGQLVALAAWLGLCGGLLEAGLWQVRTHWLGGGLSVHPDLPWMTPAAAGLLLAPLGALVAAIGRLIPRAATPGGATALLGTPAAYGVLLAVPRLDPGAALAVAMGVGLHLARGMGQRPAPWRVVRLGLPIAALLVAALAVPIVLRPRAAEARAVAALPAAPANAPNVLLVVWDTVRKKSLSLYGYERPTTPALERFAEDGVVFEHALTTAPWTLPSHGAMFTGRRTHELFPADVTPLNARVSLPAAPPTLAEVLSQHGWLTAGFVANLIYCSSAHGLNRGFAHYEDYLITLEWFAASPQLVRAALPKVRRWTGNRQAVGRKAAPALRAAFLDWLDRRDAAARARPWFAFVNYFDAHDPYLPPAEHRFSDREANNPTPQRWMLRAPAQIAALQDAYDGCVRWIDAELAQLFADLRDRGALEDTLVIVTSDHGEHFGEHERLGHTNSLYRELLEVPLVIWFPGHVPAGVRATAPVSLVDLPATVLDLVGLAGSASLPGRSLAPAWSPPATQPEPAAQLAEVLIGAAPPGIWDPTIRGYRGGMQALFARGYHYIRYPEEGGEELYDFARDANADTDLSATPAGRELLPELRALLDRLRAGTN